MYILRYKNYNQEIIFYRNRSKVFYLLGTFVCLSVSLCANHSETTNQVLLKFNMVIINTSRPGRRCSALYGSYTGGIYGRTQDLYV